MSENIEDDLQAEIIKTLRTTIAEGEEIDIVGMAVSLDLDDSMVEVRKFLLKGKLATQADWARALRVSRTVRELGFYPKTASELVDKYIGNNDIAVDYQKAMKRATLPTMDGMVITDDARKNRDVDAVARIQENKEFNTETLKRELRMKVDELGLRFTGLAIDDAVEAWFEDALAERVVHVYLSVAKGSEGPKSVGNVAAWNAVASQFDLDEHDAEFVIAVLKKFIWQVKRKMLGLKISRHLMPVIIGPQGVGKSTFVREWLLKPIEELVSNADFQSIEEVRNTEQWRNYVLFLDEMGHAGKADIDNVKNKITAPKVTGRPMRSNSNVQYNQNATFIGCSNKELNQLIRDETGNRRFVSLRYSSQPVWSNLDEIDARTLWTSVDERGDDPTLAIAAQLQEAQAQIREKSVVEQWLENFDVPEPLVAKKRKATDWYPHFKDWSNDYASGRILDSNMFGKELTRLIKAGQVTDWSLHKLNGTSVYMYSR